MEFELLFTIRISNSSLLNCGKTEFRAKRSSFEREIDNARNGTNFSWLLPREVPGNSSRDRRETRYQRGKIPLNHWVHLRYRRRGCKDRNRLHRQPAWAFSRDAIPEDSGRPAAASVPSSRISSLWLCCADSLDATWFAAEGGTARHSGKSAPGKRPTRALRLPIEVPIASPASWEDTVRLRSSGKCRISWQWFCQPSFSAPYVGILATFYITSENYCTCSSERKIFHEAFLRVEATLAPSLANHLQRLEQNF